MKKYSFGLNTVLRLRRVEEEQARAFAAEAQAEADRATSELNTRLAAIGAARPEPSSWSGPDYQEEREQMQRHAIAVTAARSAEANALAVLRVAREEWEAAAQRLRGLERLDERQRESWILEATRNAQKATDEIAQIHSLGLDAKRRGNDGPRDR